MSGEATAALLVECYWPGVSEESIIAAARRAEEVVSDVQQDGGDVRFLGLLLIPAEETVFCLFQGREADVRTASLHAGVPFERVLTSLRVDGGGM